MNTVDKTTEILRQKYQPTTHKVKAEQVAISKVVTTARPASTKYVVVLVPDVPDSRGNVYADRQVEQACHAFNLTVMGKSPSIVQSFIIIASCTLPDGQEVTKGTWVQVIKCDV